MILVFPHLVVQELSVDRQGTGRYVPVLQVTRVIPTLGVLQIHVVNLLAGLMLSVRGQEVQSIIMLSSSRPGDMVLELYVNVPMVIVEILL